MLTADKLAEELTPNVSEKVLRRWVGIGGKLKALQKQLDSEHREQAVEICCNRSSQADAPPTEKEIKTTILELASSSEKKQLTKLQLEAQGIELSILRKTEDLLEKNGFPSPRVFPIQVPPARDNCMGRFKTANQLSEDARALLYSQTLKLELK